MFTTRTGNFPIGFRRGGGEWQQEISSLTKWAKENEFAALDLGSSHADVAAVRDAGLQVGSIDLPGWQGLFSADETTRAQTVEKCATYVAEAAAKGVSNFFMVILPADPKLPRAENFGYATQALGALAPTLEAHNAQVVIEGWPGAGSLCCTPETYRALFAAVPSKSIGINYDPSHLIRMGIDPIRFLREFGARVHHVHGKDCEITAEDLYEYGWELPSPFKESPAFGETAWRYTIPGHGNSNWSEICRILVEQNYAGAICIELEDANYNGSEAGAKAGLLAGAQFLRDC